VLAAATFDLQFCYVYAGWEGSAHDERVLQDAVEQGGFALQDGYYMLGDAGYCNSRLVLTPYREIRYHLNEQYGTTNTPQNRKELFNLRHASLRNEIERIFGVLKMRFPILKHQQKYKLSIQIKLIYALCALHNFIRQNSEGDDDFELAYNQWLGTTEGLGDMEERERDSMEIVEDEWEEMI